MDIHFSCENTAKQNIKVKLKNDCLWLVTESEEDKTHKLLINFKFICHFPKTPFTFFNRFQNRFQRHQLKISVKEVAFNPVKCSSPF